MEQPTTEWRLSEIKRLTEHVARIEEKLPRYEDRRPELALRARRLAADLKLNIRTHKRELRRERNA